MLTRATSSVTRARVRSLPLYLYLWSHIPYPLASNISRLDTCAKLKQPRHPIMVSGSGMMSRCRCLGVENPSLRNLLKQPSKGQNVEIEGLLPAPKRTRAQCQELIQSRWRSGADSNDRFTHCANARQSSAAAKCLCGIRCGSISCFLRAMCVPLFRGQSEPFS